MANAKRKTILCAYMEDKINFREEMCTLISGAKVDGWLYNYKRTRYNTWYIVDEKTGMAFTKGNRRKDAIDVFLNEKFQNTTYERMQTENYARQVDLVNKRKAELKIEF